MTSSWINIASFTSAEDAYIVKGMLESNDIPVVMNNATISTVYPMTNTWAPVELLVPKAFEAQARHLIEINGNL